MRRILTVIFFFLPIAFAAAQAVSTRNNHTDFWTRDLSWEQDWAGIANPTPLPIAQISLYGYITVGKSSAGANLELPASANSTLTVYDTLRIHGNLIVGTNAHVIVEPSGVLIIHGYYNQHGGARLTNKGKIVCLGDFSISQTAGVTENKGSIYVGGRISPGARTYTSKTLTDLATEDPVTSYFSNTNVIDSQCAGSNSGTLTFSGTATSVVRWESSTDYFKKDISHIANTTNQLTYTNLLRTTSYRVYYMKSDGTYAYSNGATIITNSPPRPGEISGPTEFCGAIASATFTLSNHRGRIKRWEWSFDDFITAPQVLVTSSNTLTLTNLTTTVYIRAVLGGCNDVAAPAFQIKASRPSNSGILQGTTRVCAGTNSGTLQLQNAVGSVLRWESSTDGFKTVNQIANTTNSLSYSNLAVNTLYRVVTSASGACTEAFSNAVEVRVIQSLTEATLAAAVTQAPANGLLAHYPFIRNANDASGNGNHGIVLGATPAADRFGRTNNAYSFDGVDDVIATTLPFVAPGPKAFSISVWFKTTSKAGGRLLGSGTSQFEGSIQYDRHLYLSASGQLHFGVYVTSLYPEGDKVVVSPQSYNDGIWHHAVATLSAAGMKLYVDGVLQASDTRYTTAEDYSGYWKLGFDKLYGWPNMPDKHYYAGALDDIAIYDRELSAGEITQLYGIANETFCSGTNVQLMAALVPGATYSWTGPGEFTSTQANPLLTNIQSAQGGTYTANITLNGCVYSGSTTVVVPAEGAVVSSLSRVCSGTNSGSLKLGDYAGTVVQWESSTDNFVSNKTVIANTTPDLLFQNLRATTSYRALVKLGACGNAYARMATVEVVPTSQGGSIAGPATVCKGTNSGTLKLTGHLGDILNWEYSDDGFVAHSQTITNTTATLTFSNLISNRWYRAVVKNGECDPGFSTIFQVAVTEVIGGTLSGPARVCASANTGQIQLQGHSGTIRRWEWSKDGFQNHIQTIANTQASHAFSNLTGDTWFRAIIGNEQCADKPSTVHVVRLDQLSLGGTISGTSSVCKGTNSGTLTLADYRGQILRWEYSNDAFVAHTQAIANTSSIHTFSNLTADRWYRAVVQNNSCAAVNSPAFKVTAGELAGGTLSGPASVCHGTNAGTLSLSGSVGNIKRWESSTDNFAGLVVSNAHTSATYNFTNLTAETWFRVVVGSAECGERVSASWKVSVDWPSLGGELVGEATYCSTANNGTLQLQNQRGTILRWESSTNGFASNIQTIANTTTSHAYNQLTATTSFRAVIQNGVCAPAYSGIATITIEAPAQAGAVSGSATVCAGENSGTLSLQSKTGGVVRWESSTDGFATVTAVANTSDQLSYSNLVETTGYRAVVQNGSCPPAYSAVATITVPAPVVAGAVEGARTVVSGANAGELQLRKHTGTILYWQSSTDNFAAQVTQIANTNDTQPYLNLSQATWYRAVVQNGNCTPVYATPARVAVNHMPVARPDTLLVQEAFYTATRSILLNDSDPDGDKLKVLPDQLQTSAKGFVRIDEAGMIYYEAPQEYFGYDSFTYMVCDGVPGANLCAEATVVLDLALSLVVYQGVSPNNDGENDFWYIGFIERYPENRVQLYDRYGVLVFEQLGYNNQDKKFTGMGNKGIRPGGNMLPEGTYFYKITTSGKAPVLQGYIVLKN